MKRRMISWLLAVCMVLTMLPAEALAAEFDELLDRSGTRTEEEGVAGIETEPDAESTVETGPEPDEENTAEPEQNGEVPAEIGAEQDEDASGDGAEDTESGVSPQADGDVVQYTLDNGAVLSVGASTGTVTKCVPGSAIELDIPGEIPVMDSETGEVVKTIAVTSIGSSAFSYCSRLTGVTIPDGVTSIGSSAFRSCSGLTSITIPDSVTSIGGSAFFGCTRLTSITIPDSVTSIGSEAFNSCTGLTSITISGSITSIEDRVFYGCTGLTGVTIPDSVTSIGSEAFYNCSGLTSVTIPDSVTSIGHGTFSGCTRLTGVTIPDSVTSIEYSTFSGCTRLTGVTIPDNVTSIGNYAFYNCTRLTSVTIPDSVTRIWGSAFSGCTGLTSITIPDSVTNIESCVFQNCSGLASITIPDSVTSIEASAFSGCTGLTGITVPDSVTSIGNHAFSGCRGLTSVTIPDNVTSIKDSVFSGCSGLTSITIPNGVVSIERYAFFSCSGLTSVTIPGSVTSIGGYAFSGCSGLTSITIPNSVTRIEENAFHGCSKLTSITIPDGITTIDGGMFNNCSGLTSVTIPDSVTCIKNHAFANCRSLTSITIPDRVASIESCVFQNCSGLTSITIPDGVTSIADYAFSGCSGLTSITIPDNVTSIGNHAFQGCSGLTSITIPDGVSSIADYAFSGCSGLTSVTIPDNVTSIGSSAFSGCSGLISVTIPNSVTSIGSSAFYNCTGLTSITIPDSVTSIGSGAFTGTSPDFILYCYPGSYAESYAKNNNIKYALLTLTGRTLSVAVCHEDGTAVGGGFTVTWYDEDGNEIGTGNSLVGADNEKTYSFAITLGDDLSALYEQPGRGTIAPSDPAKCEVRLVKKAEVKTLTLSGRVADQDGAPIQGAAAVITPAGGDAVEITTGADGEFSAAVPYGLISITVRKDGCYSKRETLDLTNETGDTYDAGTYTLTPVQVITDRVTLSVTQRRAAEESDGAMELPLSSLGAMEVSVEGKDSADFEVQGLALVFKPGTVQAGEEITVTLTDPSGAYRAASATVELDGSRLGGAELTMIQKGSLVLGGVSGPSANMLLFDGNGNCVLTRAAEPGLSSGTLEAGSYRAVLIQKSELLRGVSRLDYLGTFGLNAGGDYLLKEVAIADGKITRLADCAVPTLDEGRISYTVAEHTGVSTGKPSGIAVGELLMVRAAYELDKAKNVAADSLQIVLPEGVSPAGASAAVDGKPVAYTYDAARREVKISTAGRDKAVVWLYCTPETGGSHSIGAFLKLSNGASQPIGAAVVQAENAKLNVPERTGKAEGLTASGRTMPGCTVTLYDNDEEVGTATANAAGSWNMSFSLAAPVYSYSYHNIYAVISGDRLTKPIQTESILVTYDKRLDVELTKITMYNNGGHGAQETVFDFTNASTAAPYYRIWPGVYPTFTFKAEFSGDASNLSDVCVVTTNSAGDKTYVKMRYDAASGAWVGTHDYTNFNAAPVAVTAAYGLGDLEPVAFDEEMLTDIEKTVEKAYDKTVELLVPALDGILTFSDIHLEDEVAEAKVTCTNPDTGEVSMSALIHMEISFIDDGVNEVTLTTNCYTLYDKDRQIWVKEENTSTGLTQQYVYLNDHFMLTMTTEELDQPQVRSSFYKNKTATNSDKVSLISNTVGIILALEECIQIQAAKPSNAAWKNLIAYWDGKIGVPLPMWERQAYNYNQFLLGKAPLQQFEKIFGGAATTVAFGFEMKELVEFNKTWREHLQGNLNAWDAMLKRINEMRLADCIQSNDSVSEEIERRYQAIKDDIQAYRSYAEIRLDNTTYRSAFLSSGVAIASAVALKAGPAGAFASFDVAVLTFIFKDNLTGAGKTINTIVEDNKQIFSRLHALRKYVLEANRTCGGSGDEAELPDMAFQPSSRPMQVIHDPSGYVYEAVPSNRLEGVTATISSQAGGSWNAAAYDQINPQTTGADGGYYWDVPQGNWKVSFTKAGYENADTSSVSAAVGGWLPVPPPQLEINVGMVSTAAPTVKQAAVYTDRVEVEFSQYMDITSVRGALSLMHNSTALSGCTVEALNAEYNPENTAQYATRFAITPDDTSDLSDGLAVSVSTGAKNYAGKPLASAYTSETLRASVRPTGIAAADTVSVGLHKEISLPLTLQPNAAARELVIENLSPSLIGTAKTVTTGADGTAAVSIGGILPGSGMIRITEPVSGLSKTVAVTVSFDGAGDDASVLPVEAILSDGRTVTDGMTVPRDAEITLRTNTPGAAIRYTLDDTCPCTQEALTYSGPIAIDSSTVLRAAAYKNGVYSSTIRLQLNVEDSGGTHIHSWAASWSSDANGHWHNCTAENCPITTNSGKNAYAAHTSDGGVVTTPATSSTAGVKTFSCTVCKYVIKTETIPAAGGSSSGGGTGSPRATTYKVTVPTNIPNGAVTLDNTSARRGDTVTITATPDSGYKLDSLTVTDAKGGEVRLTDKGDGKFTFTMPASRVTVKAKFAKAPVMSFTDIPSGAYYYNAVTWAVEQGITAGTSSTAFSPDAPCTRAQIVTFLWRAAGSPSMGGSNPFSDVAPGSYYFDAVQWAVAQGITVGTSATTFSPDAICTRGQTVTFLYRYEKSPEAAGRNPFTDVPADAYYTGAVLWAVEKGVTGGTTTATFSPNAICTRGQIVTFLHRDVA